MTRYALCALTLGLWLAGSTAAAAEILALLNYESKPNQAVKREGIAIMDIDPESRNFGKILMDIPLPSDLVAHHIFFNRDRSKAYVTALGKSILHVIDLRVFPYRLRAIDVPDCQVGEDLVVSEDNRTWYLTCMGSSNVIMGDAVLDRPINTLSAAEPSLATIRYPHGIAIHNGIDRLLVTSTVKPDMSDAGESITVLEAASGKVLSTHKVSSKPSPSKAAPVEVMFSPNTDPPVVHITNMLEGTLWACLWDGASKTFACHQFGDFGPLEVSCVSALPRTRYTPVRKNSSSTSFSLVATINLRIGRPIWRAMWPAQTLPKLPEGTENDTSWSLECVAAKKALK